MRNQHDVDGTPMFVPICSDSYVFREQSGREVELHGAWLWAGLQSEKEDAGSCGLQPDSGQEEGEAGGGKRRVPPGGGNLGPGLDASTSAASKRVRSAGNMTPADQKVAMFLTFSRVYFSLFADSQVFTTNLRIVVPFILYSSLILPFIKLNSILHILKH